LGAVLVVKHQRGTVAPLNRTVRHA
jgi:hypothetical protein